MRLSVASLRRLVKRKLHVEFVEQELTSYSGLEVLRRYLQQRNVPQRLRAGCGATGGDYGGGRLALLVLGLLYVGARRLEHLRYVAGDPLLARFCGLARIPTARTVGNWLRQFTQATLGPLVPSADYGAALLAGIQASRGGDVSMGDRDDSYDFSRLDLFVDKLRTGYELVMGNRFSEGIAPGAMPPLHKYLSPAPSATSTVACVDFEKIRSTGCSFAPRVWNLRPKWS